MVASRSRPSKAGENQAVLGRYGGGLTVEFADAAGQLAPESADAERIDRVHLNECRLIKIYSLALDGLPIYHGRVGAALGYLARLYCEDAALEAAPKPRRSDAGDRVSASHGI